MANVVQLSDGTTTITLTSGDYMVVRYPIQSPSPQVRAAAAAAGAQGLLPHDLGDVTETVDLLIQGSSVSNTQTNVRAIQTLIEAAQRRQNSGMGARVYIIVQLAGESAAWRSEILSARLVLDDAGDHLMRRKVEAALIITRRYFWEANSETQLSMTSSETTTPNTTVTLYNDDNVDSTKTNYINIASDQVTGSLPAPLRLLITNAETTGLFWSDFYIANTVFSTPANLNVHLDASDSGGATHTFSNANETVAWRWSLTDANLTRLAGRYYRILLALASASNDIYFRAAIQATSLQIELYRGKQVLGNAGLLFDLGAVPIPPGGYNTLGTDIDVVVYAQRTSASGAAVVDFVQLTPAGPGLFRKWKQLGFATPQNQGIEDNGPEGTIYFWDGSRRWPIVRGYGEPVHVWPGVQNRLRVLFREATFTAGRKLNAQAWVRPRRIDI